MGILDDFSSLAPDSPVRVKCSCDLRVSAKCSEKFKSQYRQLLNRAGPLGKPPGFAICPKCYDNSVSAVTQPAGVRETILDSIDEEGPAYLLGLIASGYAKISRHMEMVLESGKKDAGAIDALRNLVMERPGRLKVKRQSARYFIARSERLIQRAFEILDVNLDNYRTDAKYPSDEVMSPSLDRHFIRGLFDGAGTARWENSTMICEFSLPSQYLASVVLGVFGHYPARRAAKEPKLIAYVGGEALDVMGYMFEGATYYFKSHRDRFNEFAWANVPYTRAAPHPSILVRKTGYPTLSSCTKWRLSDKTWSLKVVDVTAERTTQTVLDSGLEVKVPPGWSCLLCPTPQITKLGIIFNGPQVPPRVPGTDFVELKATVNTKFCEEDLNFCSVALEGLHMELMLVPSAHFPIRLEGSTEPPLTPS